MKKILYNCINKLGYSIKNKKKRNAEIRERLSIYALEKYMALAVSSSLYINLLEKSFNDFKLKETQTGLKTEFNNLSFNVESKEEFHILTEIFVNRDYDFYLHQDCVIIDVGANVGFSSLFFSQLDYVKKIYAFEPVKDTYECAVTNFRENNIDKLAEIHNFGLGGKEREVYFLYHSHAKGNSGLRGALSPGYSSKKNYEKRNVKLKKASETINAVIEENLEFKIVLKIDCEGGEYEIMEDLRENRVLEKIDLILLEWHDHGPLPLEKILVASEFNIFSRKVGPNTGMITAIK